MSFNKILNKENILLSWSGGKDSALTLYEIIKAGQYNVDALLTNVIEGTDRISAHDVRIELIESQAASLGLKLHKVYLPKTRTNKEFISRVNEVLLPYKAEGITTVAYGDLFLEDIKKFRDDCLSNIGMKALYPVWSRNTRELAKEFIGLGFKAVIVCVNPAVLDRSFVGQIFDNKFLERLPSNVDPCGENGEFHSFVFNGPIFKGAVKFTVGEIVSREGFYFCDLLPNESI